MIAILHWDAPRDLSTFAARDRIAILEILQRTLRPLYLEVQVADLRLTSS